MLRSSVRTIQNLGLVGLLLVMASPLTGCLPSFKGFYPVSKKEFSAKPKGAAEILFLKDFRKVRYGQVGEGSLTTFWRMYKRIRINKRSGLSAATQVLRGGTLTKLEVRTFCPDGTKATMGLDDVQDVIENTTQIRLMKMKSYTYKFTAKKVSVGCIVDFYWEMNLKGDRFPRWAILRKYPLHKGEFTFQYREGSTYRVYLADMVRAWDLLPKWNRSSKKLTKAEREERVRLVHDIDKREIKLTLKQIPKDYSRRQLMRMVKTRLLPPSYVRTPHCQLDLVKTHGIGGRSYLATWVDVDKSFTERSAVFSETRTSQQKNYQLDEKQEANPFLAGIAAKVTAKAAGRDGKIWALYSHIQQTMTSTGRGLSSGNRLDLVYRLHRGNDYEINMLYIVMLRSQGIRAYLALLAPKNYTYQNLPPSKPFSRVATYIPSKSEGPWKGVEQENAKARDFLSKQKKGYLGGRWVTGGVVVDPSKKTMPFGYMSQDVAGTAAFIIDAGGGRFFKIPPTSYKQNLKDITLKAQIQPDGTLAGHITQFCTGLIAATHRKEFMNQPLKRWKKHLGHLMKRACGDVTTTLEQKPTLSLDKLTKPFSFSYKFSAPTCLSTSKTSVLFKLLSIPTYRLRGRKRRFPINLGMAHTVKAHVEYLFPKGYSLDQDLGTKTLNAPSLRAVVKTQRRANGLKVYYLLEVKKSLIPAKDFKAVKTFFKNLRKLLTRKVLIKKAS